MASEPEVADQPLMDHATESSRPSFDHDITPSLPSQHIVPQTAAPMSIQRRRRRSSASAGLRRSASTPNVRGTATGNSSMLSADRRGGRNKLGYHRTSIACGHCRRRKIRCLVANDDLLQRCANCIKLKKECSFLPVDHPPDEEQRSRTGSRAEAASGEVSGSSSSSPPIGSMVDQMESFNHFAPLPLSTQEYPPSTTTLSPHAHAQFSARTYEYTQHHEQPPPWDSPYLDHGPLSAGNSTPDDPSQSYWRSPLTPAFAAHFSGPPTSSSSRESGASFTSLAPLSQGLGFPMPPRSMSVHGGQDFHRNYQIHFSPAYETDIRRRASEMMHPPSLQVSRNSSNTSISEASGTPLSVHPNQWPASQPNWAPLTAPPLAKQPDFWGYSPEPGLPQVQEEDVPPPFGSPPAIVYSDAAHR